MRSLFQNWKAWLLWAGTIALLGVIPFLPVLFSGQILFASDSVSSPLWRYYFEALRHGTIPLWLPFQLGGMPTFDAGSGEASYPIFLLLGFLFPPQWVVEINFILEVMIAGWATFFLVRRYFKLDRGLSLVLAAANMLNTNYFSHIHAGHTGKFHIMSWLPLSVYFLMRSLERGTRWYHLLGLGLSITLFILTSHIQLTYYVLMGYFVVFLFAAYWIWREKNFRLLGLTVVKFWVPVLLGLGLAFPIFYPPTQWNKEFSVRGEGSHQTYEHATSWSMHPEELVSLVVPEFAGLNEKYWGRNPFKLNSEYPGLVIAFLGIFGLAVFRREKWMWLWAGVGTLAIVFGLGAHTPFFHLFYALVPGIKSMRAPSMMLFWLATALIMMSAQTLAGLRRTALPGSPKAFDLAAVNKKLLLIGGGTGVFLILCGLASQGVYGLWASLFGPDVIPNLPRQPENVGDFAFGAIKNGALVLALVFALRQWILREAKDQKWLSFTVLLLVITCADLYWTDSNFARAQESYPMERVFPREPAVEALKAEKEPFRVFGMPGAYERGYMQYNEIETIDGFADQEYNIFRELRGADYQREENFLYGLQQNPDGTVSGSPILDLLNVKYLAFRLPQDPGLKLALNKSVLPRAFLLHNWRIEPDANVLNAVKTPGFEPGRMGLIPASLASSVPAPPADSQAGVDSQAVKSLSRSYNHHEVVVESDKPGILFLSELYFPFWKVTVDGNPAPLLRVDFAFRGVYLAAGKHDIRFEYRSPWIHRGLWATLICLIAMALFLPAFRWATSRWDWA